MQLSFRSLHINWAVALALFACVLILYSTRIVSRRVAIFVAITASFTLVAALLMYEVVVGLAILPFLVVFARQGRGALKDIHVKWDLFALWICAIASWAWYFVWAIRTGSQYQLTALSGPNSVMAAAGALASAGFYRAFYECWIELFETTVNSLSSFVYPLSFFTLIAISLAYLATRSFDRSTIVDNMLPARIALVGLVAFILGYSPYLLINSHLIITQRTFLAAAVGAGLVIFAGLIFLSTIRPVLLVIFGSLLVTGCFVAQLYQFDKYNRIYATTTKPLLVAVIPFISSSAQHPYFSTV